MVENVISDVRLYRRLIGMQVRTQAQYKVNLAIDILTYFGVTSAEFLAVVLYFGTFPTLLGWKIGEVALLTGVMSISFGIAEMLGAGIDNFSDTIRLGEFDRILLRPVGAFTQVIGSDFRLRRLGRISQGSVIIIFALHLLPDLHWSLAKVAVLLVGIASGSIIFLSVMLLGATICFWTIETTELINMLTYGGREMLSYPLTIYNQAMQRFFMFVVPLAFGSYVPTCYVLGRPLPFGVPGGIAFAAPLIACAFALVAACIWHFGVRRYQSTGS
ncbi:MAG TPA: ABC-2 family transporter protein [Ktedonobacteraceae bacterium]|nr:ABC-2 family transporter protein [Ktedonobacteraceae bacterium]